MRLRLCAYCRDRMRIATQMYDRGISVREIDAHPRIVYMDQKIRLNEQFINDREADLMIRIRQDRTPLGTIDFLPNPLTENREQ